MGAVTRCLVVETPRSGKAPDPSASSGQALGHPQDRDSHTFEKRECVGHPRLLARRGTADPSVGLKSSVGMTDHKRIEHTRTEHTKAERERTGHTRTEHTRAEDERRAPSRHFERANVYWQPIWRRRWIRFLACPGTFADECKCFCLAGCWFWPGVDLLTTVAFRFRLRIQRSRWE